jgi:hypothetical protein
MHKRLVSRREIGIEIFELANGNALLEARFLDPFHLISLNLEVDPRTRRIVQASSEMPERPYSSCPDVCGLAGRLVGMEIKKGIMREVARLIGGAKGCVHLRELITEAINFCATALVGYEHGFGLMSPNFNRLPEQERFELSKTLLRNTCYAYSSSKDV